MATGGGARCSAVMGPACSGACSVSLRATSTTGRRWGRGVPSVNDGSESAPGEGQPSPHDGPDPALGREGPLEKLTLSDAKMGQNRHHGRVLSTPYMLNTQENSKWNTNTTYFDLVWNTVEYSCIPTLLGATWHLALRFERCKDERNLTITHNAHLTRTHTSSPRHPRPHPQPRLAPVARPRSCRSARDPS